MQVLQIRQWFALILLIPFLVLTAYTLIDVGFWGIFEYLSMSSAGWQVFSDLVISLLMVLTWLVPEAKRLGKNPWPWVVATFFVGAISPLTYMLLTRLPNKDKSITSIEH